MAQRLSILNHPPKLLDGPQLLHRLIDWGGHGDSSAIDFTSNEKHCCYTYSEVKWSADVLVSRIQEALRLSGHERKEQHVIPLLLPQSPGLYISQLATLESGGAFCPINLDAPKERIKFVVGDIEANIIITTSEFKETVTWKGGPSIILVDEFPETCIPLESPGTPIYGAQPVDLAYVMYTSGSSGQPKGVGVSHLAASQSLLAHERLIPKFRRFLQFAAPSFDVSVFEIFFPLTRGCTLVGCNRTQLLNDLPGIISELDVDAAELTPTVAGSLLQKRENAPVLKVLLTIGEMLTRPIVEEFGGSDTRESMLYGMYGPTEAAIHCTINSHMPANEKPGNIGVPFETVSAFVAEAATTIEDAQTLKFLPLGEIGELVLGGPQLARGYLNREDQTMAAFVNHKGCFYYRTGDKGRFLEDGTIELHGRISAGQVKIRGQRVELGEIEDAVYKHAGIKTVVAVVLGTMLIVFALADDDAISTSSVLETCSNWLPKFMIPSEIVLLRAFPYLPSGKVDRRKLESDYQDQRNKHDGDDDVCAPTTEVERIVKATLHELLGPFPSSLRLAAAGLDSLMAIRVSSQLRSVGLHATAVSVLQAETLSSLAKSCEHFKFQAHGEPSATVTIYEAPWITVNGDIMVEATFPCTPLQTSMLAETAVNEKAYRNWVEFDILSVSGPTQVEAALRVLADENSILRTGFVESQDLNGYNQIVWKSLLESQILVVEEFNYAHDQIQADLRHPLRIQLQDCNSIIKVLMHLHHAQYDAWSLELLLDDLNSILESKELVKRPPFMDLVSAYLNGMVLPNEWSSRDYWRDHLSDLDIRQMPNFHSGNRPIATLSVATKQTAISTSILEATAKRLSCSPQSLFQAAYALVLSSYLGSSDVCFGTVFSGRTLPIAGIEDIAGPCLATLPIRVDTSTPTTIQELAQQLNSINRKHLEHSSLPLRDIKSAAGIQSRQQVFDTLLIWQQTLHSYGHTRKHVTLVNAVDNLEFDLTLEIIPSVGNIGLKANYQRSVFPEVQIESLLAQLEQLVIVIIDGDVTPLDNIFKHLDDGILSIENSSANTLLNSGTLSSPVEYVAATDPDRPAIEFAKSIEGEVLHSEIVSYKELNTRSNRIAHHLLSQNVLPDELVCICMEKSVDLYASILAVTKVGAGYLPITTDTPIERLQHILQEARVKTVMSHSSAKYIFKSMSTVDVMYIDDIDFAPWSPENIPPRSTPGNISYCVFTSGSTGTPKGVLVTQGNLLSNLDVLQDIYPTTCKSRLLQSCSQAFDVSVFEIFFTFRIGGCLCSATKDVIFRDIENAVRVLNITHLSLTPTVAALIHPDNVPKVEFLVTAGEAVTQKVFNAWADRGLYQGYGPSETTNICTVNSRVTKENSINNIGPPLRNTSAFVLGPGSGFVPVPRGGEGEFCFGGSQVFRGYINAEQEVGKIINHDTFGKLYRSGDFGRLMPDGTLAFTGRKDDQVKIRGQRVELGEVNNVMLRSKDVGDCITIVTDGDEVQQRLVCFWTSGTGISSDLEVEEPNHELIAKLFDNLQASLPVYMIPSSLIPVSCLPSTAQGKIDKRLLISKYRSLDIGYLDSTSHSQKSSLDHTWTDTESKIAEALAAVTMVPIEEVGPDMSFFSLGIDSISAISFARLIRQKLQRDVQISDILKFKSVVRLAKQVLAKNANTIHHPLSSLSKVDEPLDFGFAKQFIDDTIESFSKIGKSVQKILPCTPLQEAMLSASESSSQRLYSNEVIIAVHGNMEKIQTCWQEMVKRHEILRTCFISTDMQKYAYVQVVLKNHFLRFLACDDDAGLQLKQEQLSPPYTLRLLESDKGTRLSISMHHALYDGVALSVLYSEVESLYNEHSLPPPVSFTGFLENIYATDFQAADAFWSTMLKNYRPTAFQAHHELSQLVPTQLTARIQHHTISAPLSSLSAHIKNHSTTLLSFFQATWSALLATHLQTTDIVFGNIVSGRTLPLPNLDRLVAPCFNTLPVRLQGMHNMTFLEAWRKLQALNADTMEWQFTPLRRIQGCFERADENESLGRGRLFDALFILQQPSQPLDPSIWEIEQDKGAMDFPIVCEIVPKQENGTLEIILHSHADIISEREASRLLISFGNILNDALASPRKSVLSPEVRTQILAKDDQLRIELEQRKRATRLTTDSKSSAKNFSATETELRDIIAMFTDVPADKIGRETSIFRLGLDSISTVQVATRLRKSGHIGVTAGDVLGNPTILLLASFLDSRQEIGHASKNPSSPESRQDENEPEFDFVLFDSTFRSQICQNYNLRSEDIEAVRPCTPVQMGMLAQSMHSEGIEYINSVWMKLKEGIDLETFKEAWRIVVGSVEMLRTGFVYITDVEGPGSGFCMLTSTNDSFELPWFEQNGGIGPVTTPEMNEQDILRRPWSLTLEAGDGRKSVIRFTAHHALYDAASMQMIFRDVSTVLHCRQLPTPPPINQLLNAILHSSTSSQQAKKAFWQLLENKIIINHFPDLTPLRLPTSEPRVLEIESSTLLSVLESSCRKADVTMQAATQATWARVLASYIGEPSTTFGVTLSGRSVHEDAEKVAFPTIVTVPTRCDVSGSNSELLARTMESNARLLKHQLTPLTQIQKWGGFSEGQTFDTLFAYQKVAMVDERPVDEAWEIVKEEASVDYAVSLEVLRADGKLVLRLTFRESLIPAEQARLLLRQYDALLADTLAKPDGRCDLPPENAFTKEAEELLSVTPAKEKILPGPVSLLHEFVEKGSEEWPNKTALEFATRLELDNVESQTWTYSDIDGEGNRVAQMLIEKGVLPGQIIGICFDKCAEASFAIIGILKAGCAYVALDPNAPAERSKFILEDSQAKLVLAAGKPAESIQDSLEIDVINLDNQSVLAAYTKIPPELPRPIKPQDICYCLYTSGTTGTPKGCLITHQNAVQAMYSFQRLFTPHWTPASKWLQFASFHFDVSVLEQFWSWSVGICVVSAPRDLIFEDIPLAIKLLQITHIDLTPSLARLLHPDDVPSLCKGVFITGGEQLRQEILDVWGEVGCIYNGYGPTEATIGVTMYTRVPKNGKPSNIGPQFDNVGSFVLKPGTEYPVLRGGVGELCVSGELVGEGYLNRPELSKERFPILKQWNEKVYRTGDLVRVLHNGNFIFLGRADDQVKLRGQRLELSEINEVAKKSLSAGVVEEAVTLVLKHSSQQKEQLVIFLVFSSAQGKDEDGLRISKIRDACKSRLPGYMVPTHFIPIDSLPLSANNKVDANQLAVFYNSLTAEKLHAFGQSGSPSLDQKPWSKEERHVVGRLAHILQVEQDAITRSSNIFELGLDSITIIGFARSLQEQGGYQHARLSLVKSNPSIESLMHALLNQSSSESTAGKMKERERQNAYIKAAQSIAAFSQRHMVSVCQELGVQSDVIEGISPCTPVQEGMIYRLLESEEALYFNEFEFEVESGIDMGRLISAWRRVIEKAQILRTKFVSSEDGFVQVALKPGERDDGNICGLADIDYESVGKDVALKTPFGISFSSSKKVISLRIFHGLYDGNSMSILLQRVVDEYAGLKDISYGSTWQSALPYGPLAPTPGAEEFWTRHLQGWSGDNISLILPSSSTTAAESSSTTSETITTLEIASLKHFELFRKKLGVSHQSILLAVFASALQSLSACTTTIGLVASGRSIDFPDAENIIGPLFNTVPFHTDIHDGTAVREVIGSCHAWGMEMMDYQFTALKDIQKWIRKRGGEVGERGLFDVLFVFQRGSEDDERTKRIWREVDSGKQGGDYPLAFEATLSADSTKLDLTIVAKGEVASPSQAEMLLAKVKEVLEETLDMIGRNTISVFRAPATNGVPRLNRTPTAAVSAAAEPFGWTPQACKIRTEIAALAKIPEDTVHADSSIFELGLDSIDVIKLSSRLKKQGIEVPVSVIVKSQTISTMAMKLSERGDHTSTKVSKISLSKMSHDLRRYLENANDLPSDVEAILPATPLQQSMVNEMIRSDYTRYFNIEAFKLQDGIDSTKLGEAIKRLIEQSPILRTTFVKIEDPKLAVSYAQLVYRSDSKIVSSSVASSILPEDQNVEVFIEIFRNEAIESARNERKLLQVQFVHCEKSEYMIMAISHALYDGTSLRGLHEDIARAYHHNVAARPDYLPFLEEVFQSTTEDSKSFWKTTLSNLPPSRFPRKNIQPAASKVHRLERRSQILLKDINALCKSSRITLQTLGQTCWALVLSQLMGQLDVVFGSVLSCRDTEEANDVMFPLMNTVAVRSVLHGSLAELLKYMQELSDSTRQFQHFPLGTAQAYALASRDTHNSSGNDTTLFDSLFIYQGRRTEQKAQLYHSVFGFSDVEFPVCVEMEIVDDEFLTWTTACKSSARSEGETEQIIDFLENVILTLVYQPELQTIESDGDGISVCRLPKFERREELEVNTSNENAGPMTEDKSKWSDVEKKLRRALHELSDVPEDAINKDSTIFHLGLDSILVLKLPALLRSQGLKLSVSTILKEQTIVSMAKAIREDSTTHKTISESLDINKILESATASVDIRGQLSTQINGAGNIQEILPVTAGQLFMIRQWQVSRGALFYPTFTYSLPPARIHKARLDQAWRQLLLRHDILRTGFVETQGRLTQVVFKSPNNDVIYRAQDSLPIRRSDLGFPPINLMLEEATGEDAILKLMIHHALYDGVSLPAFMRELGFLYRGDQIPTPCLTFRDFVARSIHASKDSSKDRWVSYLGTKTVSQIIPVTSDNNRTEAFYPSMEVSDLKQKAQSVGVTVDALFLAALSKLQAQRLARHHQPGPPPSTQDVIIGVYLANRAPFGEDLSALAAPTLNLLPLLVEYAASRNITDIAKEIQSNLQFISSVEMSSSSLEEIYEWTGIRVDLFVNILKDTTKRKSGDVDSGFQPKAEFNKKREIIDEAPNEMIEYVEDGRCDAFLPSIDVEIRYDGNGKIDMGIFAPTAMLELDDAEGMIRDFVNSWN